MYVLGIDIGSAACKAVILRDNKEIAAKKVVPIGTGTTGPEEVFDLALKEAGIDKEDLTLCLATGYGRFTFPFAKAQKSEIGCHAKGIHHLFPQARTIIDIGGQDVKVIKLNPKGGIINFVMNDKCAAGTGRFLDNMSKVLNIPLDKMGPLSLEADGIIEISSTCTVFAESEVISQLSKKIKIENLIAGIHQSVAKRSAALMHRNGIVPEIAMSGGVTRNPGLVKALEDEIGQKILVHEDSQFAGALGAALFALEEADKKE